ncbi:MAG: 5-(carboxyamino)imidazole ribonucleotide mutase [Planctomycetota bacterium]
MTSRVAVVMGSDSDLPQLEGCFQTLADFEVPFEARVLSAHRTPDRAMKFAREARERGVQVLIAAAGGAAHLAGALAAHSLLPVIGIPLASTSLNGMDALLATVQMPPGIPVATVAVGKMGATNAALLAIQIMSLSDESLYRKLENHRKEMAAQVEAKDRDVSARFGRGS